MKQLFKLLLVSTFIVLGTVPIFAETIRGNCGNNGSNVSYVLDTNTHHLTISGTGVMCDFYEFVQDWDYDEGGYWDYIVPWNTDEYWVSSVEIGDGVTSIGQGAFYHCDKLTSISIPSSVTSICGYAFAGCSNLTTINIPESVTYIGNGVFSGCNKLPLEEEDGILYFGKFLMRVAQSHTGNEYKIREGTKWIGEGSFANKNMTSITIPNSVVCICRESFYGCSRLTSVYIPKSVSYIGDMAFYCSGLKSVTLASSDTRRIGDAFDGCWNLGNVYCLSTTPRSDIYHEFPRIVTLHVQEGYATAYQNVNSRTFTIVDDLKVGSCGAQAEWYFSTQTGALTITGTGETNNNPNWGLSPFSFTKDITKIEILDGITSIAHDLFSGCFNLSSVSLPNSVTSIGSGAFWYCRSLSSIAIPNSVNSFGVGVFSRCTNLTEPLFNDKFFIKLPENYEGSYTIPTGLDLVNSAFEDCSGLTSVIIPNSVTSIGSNAFDQCTSLTSVSIPNSVTSIGDNAFLNCNQLTSITIPNSVTSIGSQAFYYCRNLASVTCKSITPPSCESSCFSTPVPATAILFVPEESIELYKTAKQWKDFSNIEAMPVDADIVDGEDFSNTKQKHCNTITYTRTFTNTSWNALYVPFAMSYEDWSADFEIARLNDVHQFDDDEDGEIDRTVLESVKLKAGSSIEPNTPYMIKAKEAGEKTITLTDATLYAAEENSFDVTSWFTRFTFTGTYSTVTDMATKGHYAVANGGLMKASSDAVTLGAFRWYLDVTDRNGNPAPLKAKKVFLSFDDGETTAIDVVEANTTVNDNAVYSISGVNVGNNKASLHKGLYISNGKKYLIK